MKKLVFFLILLLTSIAVKAFQPLPPEQAFAFSAQFTDKNTLNLTWQIAPGYYLYREQFKFELLNAGSTQLAPTTLPAGIPKQDDILGKYQVYENSFTVPLTLMNVQPGNYVLQVNYQGCAAAGFCYPPVTKQLQLTIGATSSVQIVDQAKINTEPKTSTVMTSPNKVDQLLGSHNWLLIIGGFFIFGVFLAFTPCVLPMMPILSGIIMGQSGKLNTRRAFNLSLTYVLAAAVTYAGAGITAALAGSYIQAILQNPWMIGLSSLMFVLLALALFDFYHLQMPAKLNHYFMQLSHRQQSGTYVGVAIMGCLSVLIVSPCVTAPLIGVLSYIGNSGDVVLGGTALFSMGLGMGVPLLIIGTSEGKWAPKSGPWLKVIKEFFGVLLLAVAIWLIQRIVSGQVGMLLWAALAIITGVYLGALVIKRQAGWRNLGQGIGLILLIYGVALVVGALQGNTDPLKPLAFTAHHVSKELKFQSIKNTQELQQALALAKTQNKPVLIDFYADWCISCKQIEKNVMGNLEVQQRLQNFMLLRADVTANNADDKALEQSLNVVAPPTIVFFATTGEEIKSARIFGELSAAEFLQRLNEANL